MPGKELPSLAEAFREMTNRRQAVVDAMLANPPAIRPWRPTIDDGPGRRQANKGQADACLVEAAYLDWLDRAMRNNGDDSASWHGDDADDGGERETASD